MDEHKIGKIKRFIDKVSEVEDKERGSNLCIIQYPEEKKQ